MGACTDLPRGSRDRLTSFSESAWSSWAGLVSRLAYAGVPCSLGSSAAQGGFNPVEDLAEVYETQPRCCCSGNADGTLKNKAAKLKAIWKNKDGEQ